MVKHADQLENCKVKLMSYVKPYLQEKSNKFILHEEKNNLNANESETCNKSTVQQTMALENYNQCVTVFKIVIREYEFEEQQSQTKDQRCSAVLYFLFPHSPH